MYPDVSGVRTSYHAAFVWAEAPFKQRQSPHIRQGAVVWLGAHKGMRWAKMSLAIFRFLCRKKAVHSQCALLCDI
jgi:hypothetical protein